MIIVAVILYLWSHRKGRAATPVTNFSSSDRNNTYSRPEKGVTPEEPAGAALSFDQRATMRPRPDKSIVEESASGGLSSDRQRVVRASLQDDEIGVRLRYPEDLG